MRSWLRLLAPLLPLALVPAAFAQPAPVPPPASATFTASAVSPAPPAPGASLAVASDTASPASTAAAEAPTRAPEEPAFPLTQLRLANGLQVLLSPDATLPNVTVFLRYDVGSRDEPDGLSGIAHLTEHLMFEGSRHVPRGMFLRMLMNAGATGLNGETGLDATYYHETVPPERLDLALWLESDRMGYFLDAVSDSALEQERKVVMAERRERISDEPLGMVPVFLMDATFPPWHPYHAASDDSPEDIANITLADVRAFFATWYGPQNATLVLAGRFDPASAEALVRRYFETLPSRPPPRRPALPSIEKKGPTRLWVEAGVASEQVDMSWRTPAFGAPGDAELDWVAALLARGETSRLRQRLLGDGLAKAVSAGQTSKALAGIFTIEAIGAPGQHAEQIRDAIDQELRRLGTLGPTETEMSRVRAYWGDRDMFQLESAGSRAGRIAAEVAIGPLKAPFDWTNHRRMGFTAAAIRDAVHWYLQPEYRAAEVLSRQSRSQPLAGVVVKTEEP